MAININFFYKNVITIFEKNLSKFVNRKYACAVSSGTAALEISVKSLGLNKNDEIIMPSFTIISNAIAIIKNFAKPVLIDSDLDTWNIDIQKIEKKINKKTKAIMLPHIYGFPCDMDKILKICKMIGILHLGMLFELRIQLKTIL